MPITSDAKQALKETVRSLRARLLTDLHDATESAWQMGVGVQNTELDQATRATRASFEAWATEQVRTQAPRPRPRGPSVPVAAAPPQPTRKPRRPTMQPQRPRRPRPKPAGGARPRNGPPTTSAAKPRNWLLPRSDDAVAKASESVRDLKILDPAVGFGHFLVVLVGLLWSLYREEARHRGLADDPDCLIR